VIQIFLDYGENATLNLPERKPHWKEFSEEDARRPILRHRLAPVLEAQTLSAVVLAGAVLQRTAFAGLTQPKCTQEQLESAESDKETGNPDGMLRPKRWLRTAR